MAETAAGAAIASTEHSPVAGVVPWGVAAGVLGWGLAGGWRAAQVANYPWNVWTPIGYGAVKGVFLGALAGWCAALALRSGRAAESRPLGRTAVAALLGGLAPGTVRDFLGAP
ncbi:hypothetical protein ACIQF6_02660 [Kitasatospora sp. NPDC092948]|uniref:hypothetical protein n=1 Tax=Kitasatospora sp. NPDC092948 TaxID=3364088 RepID=UPI0037F361AF